MNLPDTISWELHRFDEVSSTNDAARAFAERGASEGVVVIADRQTAGRGRHGRTWQSPAGAGLYVSVLLRPEPPVAAMLTLAAGVALAEGISECTGVRPALKWPNDVYVGARKLAGILAEGSATGTGVAHVVLGFGVNLRRAAFPPDVAARATSLEGELGRAVDADVVLRACLGALAARYDDLRHGRGESVLRAWRAYATPFLGRRVEWDDRGVALRGAAEDVDAAGALVVRTDAGLTRVISGEVRWI